MEDICRLCGMCCQEEDLKISLNDVFGEIQFKHLVSYYCRFDLLDYASLPQKVCVKCIDHIRNFVNFSHEMEIVQDQLNSTLSQVKSEEDNSQSNLSAVESDDNQTQNSDDNSPDESLLVPVDTPIKAKKSGRQPPVKRLNPALYRFSRLFKRELANHQSTFAELNVPESDVARDGEVKLADARVWSDFSYSCMHCKMKYDSLENLLMHFRADVPYNPKSKPWNIKCTVCWSEFSRWNYINHVKEHHNHLPFTCIACSKIYQNMAFLLKHYLDEHPNTNHLIHFCVYCGKYFSDFQTLKLHKASHNHNVRKPVDTKLEKKRLMGISSRLHSMKITEAATNRLSRRRATFRTSSITKVSPLKKKRDTCFKRKSATKSRTVEKKDESRAVKLNAISEISSLSTKSETQRPCPLSKKNQSQIPANGKIQVNVVQSSTGAVSQKPCPLSKKLQTLEKAYTKPCPLSKKTKGLSQDHLMSTQNRKTSRDNCLITLPNTSSADLESNENSFAAHNGTQKRKHGENEKYCPDQPSKNIQIKSTEFPEIGKRIMKRRMTCQ